jgi:HSP20 family molecular chaperone IbpA
MPRFPGRPGAARARPGPPAGARPALLAEFAELHDAYVAEVELPGVRKNQMRIELVVLC